MQYLCAINIFLCHVQLVCFWYSSCFIYLTYNWTPNPGFSTPPRLRSRRQSGTLSMRYCLCFGWMRKFSSLSSSWQPLALAVIILFRLAKPNSMCDHLWRDLKKLPLKNSHCRPWLLTVIPREMDLWLVGKWTFEFGVKALCVDQT